MTDGPISEPSPAIRVLLVEDDDFNRLLLTDYLTHHGYQVLGLAEGSSFFSTLAQFQPHVVLLDLKLP
ncbi:response regulator, partial [Trichocoleus sp. FACHB-591]|uniref:response regulator n=1 Tax=Trichocoleus sp. FACHB-591 TaxID=2692872 RepID=UPI00168594D5